MDLNEVMSFPYYGGEELHAVDCSKFAIVKVERRQGVSKATQKSYDFYVCNAYITIPGREKPLCVSVETPRQNDLIPLYFNRASVMYVEPSTSDPYGKFCVVCRSDDDTQKVHCANFKTFIWSNGKKVYDYEKTQTLQSLFYTLCAVNGVNL